MYQCTPKELREQKGEDVIEMLRDIVCMGVEADVERLRRKLHRH